MRRLSHIVALCALSSSVAWATPVDVAVVDGVPATIVIDGEVVGAAPMTLDLTPGAHAVAFRSSAFSPTAFDVKVFVADVPLRVEADWGKQVGTAVPRGQVAPSPTLPASSSSSVVSAAPATAVGDVFVTSEPAGAPISVDGVATGLNTPALVGGLAPGKHKIEVATDCDRASSEVVVREALVARAEMKLERGTGTLRFASSPSGATVVVDGKDVGRTPLQIPQVACGEHTWAVRLAGYLPFEHTGLVPAFRATEVTATLEKERFGTLVFLPQPVDAALTLDGVALGVGPRTVEHVGVGAHTVVGTREGLQTTSLQIQVAPDVVSRIDVVLTPPVVATAAPSASPVEKSKPAPSRDGVSDRTTKPAKDKSAPAQDQTPAPGSASSAAEDSADVAPPQADGATAAPRVTPNPSGPKLPSSFSQAKAPRLVVNSAVTLGGLTALGFAVRYWVVAGEWYQGYLNTEDPVEAEYLYVEQLVPRRNLAIATTGVGAALLTAAGVLWGTTDFTVAPTGNGVVLGGRF